MIRKKIVILAGLLAGVQLLSACSGKNSFPPVLIATGQNTDQRSLSVQSMAQAQYLQEPEYKNDEERYIQKDGKTYEKVTDLIDGKYHWASALTEGRSITDDHGHETVDYDSQQKTFVSLDGTTTIEVRRWDELLYSAGDYLVFGYDGEKYVSKADDLYHPVLSYTGDIIRIPGGFITADNRAYKISFYDEEFHQVRVVEGYRFDEERGDNRTYVDGLAPVRDMSTGWMGFMDMSGNIAIACEYGYVSNFSGGYASVLTGSTLCPYTEDGGTVSMFDAEGGQWAIIDTEGNYAVAPSEVYANQEAGDGLNYYCGGRRFSDVRADGTADFLDISDGTVLETVRVK